MGHRISKASDCNEGPDGSVLFPRSCLGLEKRNRAGVRDGHGRLQSAHLDDPAEAQTVVAHIRRANPTCEREVLTGSADEIAEQCRTYATVGFTHVIYHSPAPHDKKTLERFAAEVRRSID